MASDPFPALAHPTRREILALLRDNPGMSAGELAAKFPGVSRPAVSRHLGVLRRARLVHSSSRGREQRYNLNAEPIAYVYRTFLSSFLAIADESLLKLKHEAERPLDE
ncbi:MAG: winged helix-turn-helix transcriptional regulator [Chloroflexi bacterium]|nr:winged helix-turn-helix transcriptional regulator [Chloroflexota bacterium]